MISKSLLFLGKRGDENCQAALAHTKKVFANVTELIAGRGDTWPEQLDDWQGDYIISYLSPFIVKQHLIANATEAAINFHPGPPEYPGIGCTNFALYNEETEFGVTCHHMAAKVDTGGIIAVRRIAIKNDDSVYSLTQRCYGALSSLFDDIINRIGSGGSLPESSEKWTRAPYLRKELNELCEIKVEMGADEVARRVRAVTFPGAPGAWLEFQGHSFEYCPDFRKPADL